MCVLGPIPICILDILLYSLLLSLLPFFGLLSVDKFIQIFIKRLLYARFCFGHTLDYIREQNRSTFMPCGAYIQPGWR